MQAKHMARWLLPRLPQNINIHVSPSLRTQQTAQALNLSFNISPALTPHAEVTDLQGLVAQHVPSAPLLLIGHQPTLGRFAATLLTGSPINWAMRKGALWWLITQDNSTYHNTTLKLVISPNLL
jgi:phosphohistidine phosphatase